MGTKKIIKSFSESTLVVNAYRGERLGLMAIHLLLVSVNRVHNTLVGSVEEVSDCLGALKRVVHIPPYQMPLCCKHSDILKHILINCRDLTFTLYYSHVKAHQDDSVAFNKLSRKSQLIVCATTWQSSAAVNPHNDSSKTTTYSPWNPLVSLLRVQSCCLVQASRYPSMRTVSLQKRSFCGSRSCPAMGSKR